MLKLSETISVSTVDVRVIGIGGAGCSSLNRLADNSSGNLSMLGIDTGSAATTLREGVRSITIGSGFGSGGSAEAAVEQFLDAEPDITSFIGRAGVVILLAGLGRGTGSGLSPRIAQIARDSGALTIAAVNMPFEFEGRFRNQAAVHAHRQLEAAADAVITMSNDDLSTIGAGSSSLNDAFQEVDQNIAGAVHAITTALESSPERFAAARRSLQQAGRSAVLSGTANGLHAGKAAVISAFDSTCPRFTGTSTVDSAVLHIEGGIGLSLGQVAEAVTELRSRVGRGAEVHVSSERLIGMGQEIKISLVLAGIDNERMSSIKIAPMVQFGDRDDIHGLSIFETSEPKRTRGPLLLPAG